MRKDPGFYSFQRELGRKEGYKARKMHEVSYGKCINFKKCGNIDDLADGLCLICWDKTSYKDDEYREEEVVDNMILYRVSRRE